MKGMFDCICGIITQRKCQLKAAVHPMQHHVRQLEVNGDVEVEKHYKSQTPQLKLHPLVIISNHTANRNTLSLHRSGTLCVTNGVITTGVI